MDTINLEIRRAERNFWAILATIAISLLVCATAKGQTPEQWKTLKADINLFVANDLGRNGYYDQKPIAELMGVMAEEVGPEAIIATGDVHHFDGVASTQDPLWLTNYELIYTHPELMISWLPVLGNHEYRGNTQAVLDYSKVSRRWQMEGRYYTKVFADEDAGASLRVVFIDTTPLIDSYRNNNRYPDAGKQDIDAQLQWLDNTLQSAKEDWVIVVGHHPMYAETKKDIAEQKDIQRRLLPIFKKHGNVAMYICGHIHNFQHIRKPSDSTDYIVNTAGSLARKVKETDGTQFCSPSTGFSVLSATKQKLQLHMIDKEGKEIHCISKEK
ncbi:MAG: metallophosphoesterase [Prevotellaceae bacterium]|nr:metallophosphoesterase [Prevotellaceae bacterium]